MTSLTGAPIANFSFPWDEAGAPPPVAALSAARAELGDTFEVHSGDDHYLFLFSESGLASFYGLAEREASKGLADYRMLLRKLPPELFDGRRTFAHDLFGAQLVEDYLDHLDRALAAELALLADRGEFDAFELGRRLGHRLGLACWIGPEVALGSRFDELMAAFERLDGADAFVHPERIAAVRASDYAEERAALHAVVSEIGSALADRSGGGFLDVIEERWADTDGATLVRGVAYDVVLLHVATMTNLVAALGWALLAALERPDEPVDLVALEAIAAAQRSIMMRTALRDLEVDGWAVRRGTIVATMLPVTHGETEPTLITTFGHGSHRCPAKRFSMTAIARTVAALRSTFELTVATVPDVLEYQIGGVGRPAGPCPVTYVRRG